MIGFLFFSIHVHVLVQFSTNFQSKRICRSLTCSRRLVEIPSCRQRVSLGLTAMRPPGLLLRAVHALSFVCACRCSGRIVRTPSISNLFSTRMAHGHKALKRCTSGLRRGDIAPPVPVFMMMPLNTVDENGVLSLEAMASLPVKDLQNSQMWGKDRLQQAMRCHVTCFGLGLCTCAMVFP